MNRVNFARLACLQLAIATVAVSGPATAATRVVNNVSNAAGICQSALPAFDGLIRKRPLAIQNEGTSNAFVTCAFTQTVSDLTAINASIYAKSNDNAAHTVTCTGVAGFAGSTTQASVKTRTVPADGGQVSISWSPSDFTGSTTNLPSYLFSVSCMLPPGSGLNDTYIANEIDVGS